MDPATAIGLAVSIVQLIESSSQLYNFAANLETRPGKRNGPETRMGAEIQKLRVSLAKTNDVLRHLRAAIQD